MCVVSVEAGGILPILFHLLLLKSEDKPSPEDDAKAKKGPLSILKREMKHGFPILSFNH